MSERNVPRPGLFIWTVAGSVLALGFAHYAGIQAAERHSTQLWTARVVLIASALPTFTGAVLEWRRRVRSHAAEGWPERVEGPGDG